MNPQAPSKPHCEKALAREAGHSNNPQTKETLGRETHHRDQLYDKLTQCQPGNGACVHTVPTWYPEQHPRQSVAVSN